MVRKMLPGVVNSVTLARKLDRLELKLRPLRPLDVILAQSVQVSPHQLGKFKPDPQTYPSSL